VNGVLRTNLGWLLLVATAVGVGCASARGVGGAGAVQADGDADGYGDGDGEGNARGGHRDRGSGSAEAGVRGGEGRPFPSRVASVAFEVKVGVGGAEIAGFVRDRDGNPVGRACVELAAPGAARTPIFTSAQGNFRFTRVPAGLVRVTMTVEDLEVADGKQIADYHTQDPRLTVMLRPLVIAPPGGQLEVLRIKREGDYGQGDGTRWIEVAPLALDLQGYSPACRRALAPPPRRRSKS
jgi:hypothetical protein